jgi:hypothetical protein
LSIPPSCVWERPRNDLQEVGMWVGPVAGPRPWRRASHCLRFGIPAVRLIYPRRFSLDATPEPGGVWPSHLDSFTRTKGQQFWRRRRSSSAARSRSSSSRRRTLEMIGSCGSPFPQAARLVKGRGGGPVGDEDTPGSTSARTFLHSTRRWYMCWSFQPPSRHPELLGRRTGGVPVNLAEDRWCQVVLSGPPSRRRCSIASGFQRRVGHSMAPTEPGRVALRDVFALPPTVPDSCGARSEASIGRLLGDTSPVRIG